MPVRQRLKKLLSKIRHKSEKDKRKSATSDAASTKGRPTGDSRPVQTSPGTGTDAPASPPRNIARERPLETTVESNSEQPSTAGQNAKPKTPSRIPISKRPSSVAYSTPRASDIGAKPEESRRWSTGPQQGSVSDVKQFPAFGPESQSRPDVNKASSPNEGVQEPQQNAGLLGLGSESQIFSKRFSRRSDLTVPSRTMTENTLASSDYDNHSTTQSLGPSPVPTAAKEVMDDFGDSGSGVSNPRARNQTQPDAVDAFPNSADVSAKSTDISIQTPRIPFLSPENRRRSSDLSSVQGRKSTGTFGDGEPLLSEESRRMTAELEAEGRAKSRSISRKSATTELRNKVEKAVVNESVKPSECEIRTEVITREIHYHNIYTSVQPLVERKYLPTKHYLQDENGHIRPISPKEAERYGDPIWIGEEVVSSDPHKRSQKFPRPVPWGYKNKGAQADPAGIDRTQSLRRASNSQGQQYTDLDDEEKKQRRHTIPSMIPVPARNSIENPEDTAGDGNSATEAPSQNQEALISTEGGLGATKPESSIPIPVRLSTEKPPQPQASPHNLVDPRPATIVDNSLIPIPARLNSERREATGFGPTPVLPSTRLSASDCIILNKPIERTNNSLRLKSMDKRIAPVSTQVAKSLQRQSGQYG